jgi:hypothetical protein
MIEAESKWGDERFWRDYARVLKELNDLIAEDHNLKGVRLVAAYFDRRNQWDIADAIMSTGRPKRGQLSRKQYGRLWRDGEDGGLYLLSFLLEDKSYRGVRQRELYRLVESVMKNRGLSPSEAAWRVERTSTPKVDHAQVLRAWEREKANRLKY